ncbi:MBOAT family protein [Dysgonomonas sp. 520]|uniref:MBOAT family O-acyltransferase n=1 Tax=Dysgonomonas sp. 520 TaxID=2302931 RepID=UPI0013D3C49E|nr:MBOAT family protein [Dysgonomonas sp. 520]NDW09140.1 MBOAT family protein [Dysgonomonas sp. 520]
MELNSLGFLFFFVAFFILYWFGTGGRIKLQNILLLAGSYLFYAVWDWKCLFLLIASSAINYFLGIEIGKTENEKKRQVLVWFGVLYGILSLVYFKYTNFFITSFIDAFAFFEISLNIHTLKIILPLGISFYTFRTISYILDVDKGKIEPVTNWINFFAYVAFFPCIIAGPIDKARTFVPQLEKKREFDYSMSVNGLKQILWGLFKKVVVADNCAEITNHLFADYANLPSYLLLLGAFLYTVQLYTDFSGYSDMAIGIAKLLGINVTINFNYPFFVQNVAHYWRNWHMSLTSWLTEYVFTPLSIKFRDYDKWGIILASIINFVIVGAWHGANWTFVLFGFLHGCYFIPLILRGRMNKKIPKIEKLPNGKELRNMVATFLLIMFTNVVFRADSVSHAFSYLAGILTQHFVVNVADIEYLSLIKLSILLVIILVFFMLEWKGRAKECPLYVILQNRSRYLRWAFYYVLIVMIFLYVGEEQEFIYAQF